jgi:hypothetical protein
VTEDLEPNQITANVSRDERLIQVRLTGRPKASSIVAMLGELDALVAKDPTLRVLIDEDDLKPSFIGPADIRRFVDAWRSGSALRATRIAVFTSNIAMYGLNRMFQGLANAEDRVSAFHNRTDALAWLNDELAS